MATRPRILAWEIPQMEEPCGLQPWSCKELDTTEPLNTKQYSGYCSQREGRESGFNGGRDSSNWSLMEVMRKDGDES